MPSAANKASFDELLSAMAEVDRARTEEDILAREAAVEERRQEVCERLKAAYAAQGVSVDDAILKAGVVAYFDKRLRHQPWTQGAARWLALAWIERLKIGIVAAVVGLFAFAGVWSARGVKESRAAAHAAAEVATAKAAADRQARFAADSALAERLIAEGLSSSKDPVATEQLTTLRAASEEAISSGNAESLSASIQRVRDLIARLRETFELRIVNEPGKYTELWFYSNESRSQRTYYVVVEAVDPLGKPVAVRIKSASDGAERSTSTWGEQVPKELYDEIGREKKAGAIRNSVFGKKEPGKLSIDYRLGPKADHSLQEAEGRVNNWPNKK
jgi:hypothetical protein